jgi:Fe-S-cluster containining protein
MSSQHINEAEQIAKAARRSISSFCCEECRAYCCRKGHLNLSPDNIELVTQGRGKELEGRKLLSKVNEANYSLYLGSHDSPCPCLKDYKCIIHKSPRRPLACRDFPLFLEGSTIKLSSRCLAVKQGLLFPYIHKLTRLGYKLLKTDSSIDFDFDSFSKTGIF